MCLARWMAGDFSNQKQAYANPPFYAHIRVAMRPLDPEKFGGIMLFVEQAYDYCLQHPYRLRVLHFKQLGDHLEIENFKVKEAERFNGAARDRQRLQTLTPDDLVEMPGCELLVEWTGTSFKGVVKPGKHCRVVRNGKETYLESSFEISETGLISLDRGYDLETNERVWGSVAGAFEFERWESYAAEVIGQ